MNWMYYLCTNTLHWIVAPARQRRCCLESHNAITGNAKTKPGSPLSTPLHKSILSKKLMESQLLLRKTLSYNLRVYEHYRTRISTCTFTRESPLITLQYWSCRFINLLIRNYSQPVAVLCSFLILRLKNKQLISKFRIHGENLYWVLLQF